MNNHNKIRKLNRCGFSFLKNVCLLSEKSIKITQKWHLACVRHIDAFKNRIVYYFMNQYMKPFIDLEYQGCKKVRHDIDDQNIWVLWLQGEHNMPEIVSLCFQKLQENSSGHNIILLTKGNLNSYLDISANILNRVGKSMSYAAFSDYLRYTALVECTHSVGKSSDAGQNECVGCFYFFCKAHDFIWYTKKVQSVFYRVEISHPVIYNSYHYEKDRRFLFFYIYSIPFADGTSSETSLSAWLMHFAKAL